MNNNHIFPFLWMRGEEEAVLRKEIEKIAECGIGAVCVEARPHEEFCKDGWWHDMDIVLDEAKKRDMKVWILDDKHFPTGYANGLIAEKYPERRKLYINRSKANVFGFANRKLTLNVKRMLKPAIGFWEIEASFANMAQRSENELLAVIAVRIAEGKELHEDTIDLTETVDGDFASFTLPEGKWSVNVIYKTRTDGGNDSYINMIDKQSASTQIEGVYETHFARYANEFGKTIAGFFSDEPQFGNIQEVCYDAALGKKKMPLPWSAELEEMLVEIHGSEYVQYLPFLFQETEEKQLQHQIRYDYMNAVSMLYKKNFSDAIGAWCEAHNVEYIGHVVEDNGCHSRFGMGAAHYFRAMSGQHMAGIDCIGEQVVFGAPSQEREGMGEIGGSGEFHHYTLGKLGASCGHLDPMKKGRTMCELFGAYGWNYGVRDMKYLLEHLLVKGVNELVPHAFSMAEYPDPDCPPHFYAHGHNPQFPAFAELMKYANRMCELLSHGQHVASVAVLYDGEADWVGNAMPMQKVCRELTENQIDFDIVSTDMLLDLASYNGSLTDGRLSINGVEFSALIVPYTRALSQEFYSFIEKKGSFSVIFTDEYPDTVIHKEETDALDRVCTSCEKIALQDLAVALRSRGYYEITLNQEFKGLSFYHYKKDRDIYVFLNESATQTFDGTVTLPGSTELVYYNAFKEQFEAAEYQVGVNETTLTLTLEPAECVVIMTSQEETPAVVHQSFRQQLAQAQVMDISENWKVSLIKAVQYPMVSESFSMELLVPVSEERPAFAGIIRYEKEIVMNQVPAEVFLKAEQVYEIMQVFVNGTPAGMCMAPPYQMNIAKYLHEGSNEITIEVATTPSRDQLAYPQPPFDFSYEAMEATGMCGKVELYVR